MISAINLRHPALPSPGRDKKKAHKNSRFYAPLFLMAWCGATPGLPAFRIALQRVPARRDPAGCPHTEAAYASFTGSPVSAER
ncbi:MAG: hypothetical protein IJC34_08415 [Lentisphaeria bacterium]|nr:hypothetical protein [Lentisphaeria bacterium]